MASASSTVEGIDAARIVDVVGGINKFADDDADEAEGTLDGVDVRFPIVFTRVGFKVLKDVDADAVAGLAAVAVAVVFAGVVFLAPRGGNVDSVAGAGGGGGGGGAE